MNQPPAHTLCQTLPELKLAFRGWQRANGTDPDSGSRRGHATAQSMSLARLKTLAEKYGNHDRNKHTDTARG